MCTEFIQYYSINDVCKQLITAPIRLALSRFVLFFLLLFFFFPPRSTTAFGRSMAKRQTSGRKKDVRWKRVREVGWGEHGEVELDSRRCVIPPAPPIPRSFSLLLSRTMPSDCTPTLEVFERLAERLIVLPQSQGPKTISM